MKDFVAIDFETANGQRSSVCSVGIVIVKDGEMVDSFYALIKPMPNLLLLGHCYTSISQNMMKIQQWNYVELNRDKQRK